MCRQAMSRAPRRARAQTEATARCLAVSSGAAPRSRVVGSVGTTWTVRSPHGLSRDSPMSEDLDPRPLSLLVDTLPPDDGIWRLAHALAGAASPSEVAAALAEEGAAAAGASFSNMAVLSVETGRVR